MKKWKVLIVTNGIIIPEYYENDKKFNNENYSFFNVGKEKLESDKFSVINSCEIEGYEYLGKDWAESEVIYNIYKLDLFKDYDYIGLMHYDFNFYCNYYKTNRITENIDNLINNGNKKWISFFAAPYLSIKGKYDVLMDERKPNCLFVRNSNLENPKSCNSFIADKLNCEFGTNFNFNSVNENYPISLCCSFLTEEHNIKRLGKMIYEIKSSRILEKFDIEKRHRYPGQFMERFVAMYSILNNNGFNFNMDHRFTGGKELNQKDPNGENY